MKIAVLKESADGETRCSAIPETVKKFSALGASVAVERGAGQGASIADADFEAAGASVGTRADVLKGAEIILCVTGPDPASLKGAAKGALLVGALDPSRRREAIDGYAAAGLDAMAMEWMPRITRAQSMDILSSQSNLAGYKAVIEAADAYGRAFPMMMTAAGTVSAAKVFVMGVGRRGLAGDRDGSAARRARSARPTCARRPRNRSCRSAPSRSSSKMSRASKARAPGGYATEMSAEYQKAQAELVSAHIAKQDIVITTALIPGKPAPRLISDAQLASMRPGSVVVDLAAEAGGNVEGCVAGERVEKHGVTIIGASNLARSLAADSSALFARNLYNFLSAFWDKDAGKLVLPDDDELVKGIRLTSGGKVVHERLA